MQLAPVREKAPDSLSQLAREVAEACGYAFVPPTKLRRGQGGDWRPQEGLIRIGRASLRDDDRLWGLLAHELAHAQASQRERHSMDFWRRFAEGLQRAGRLELLRYEFGYREGAMRVAREFGLIDVPGRQPFRLSLGASVKTEDGHQWRVRRRFRIAGEPIYRLTTRGWRWVVSEQILMAHIEAAQQGG